MRIRDGNIIVCSCGVELNPTIITPFDFIKYADGIATCGKCQGSGAVEMTTAQVAATLPLKGNSVVNLGGGTYNLNNTVQVPDGCTVEGNGAIINLLLSTDATGLVLGNNTTLRNLTVNVTVNGVSSGAGQFQCPIVIGDYVTGIGKKNIGLQNITVKSNRPNGNGVLITGNSHNITISNLTVIGESKIGRGVLIHWGGASKPTAGTLHPYNVVIGNVYMNESFSAVDCAAVFMSAAYNIKITNVYTDNCYNSILAFAGDYGDKYATAEQRGLVGRGCTVDNVTAINANRVVKVEGLPTVDGNLLAMPLVLNNIKGIGKLDSESGIVLGYCCNTTINNCEMCGFKYHGIATNNGTNDLRVVNGSYHDNGYAGVYVGGSVVNPERAIIDGVHAYNNNLKPKEGETWQDIHVGLSKNVIVRDCF